MKVECKGTKKQYVLLPFIVSLCIEKKNVVHLIYSESNLRLQLDSKSTVLQYDKKVLH